MILVDSNILMYAAGAEHPHKIPSLGFLEQVARGAIEAAIDAEALQEILHRYRLIHRWEEGRQVFDLTRKTIRTTLPITVEVLDRARGLLDLDEHLMARDAVHAAVVLINGAQAICSYDRDFDRIDGVRRIEPTST